ncbi:MAG TPA: tRNA (adenosine(37)-N6)-threonylcarbamoyltransferase complex transferase subunit TsaD [Syntrophomonadaceae bacterium]|nr:tRNA (adenosine(37)-N6)-threonylcarbamoyltransferase complex transferase subunit TsaD [Syntrophomonadaceae bacterium]
MENLPPVYILGIETSCDETSAAVIRDGHFISSNIIASQIDIHRRYGGVVPEVASRQHLEKITFVVERSLKDAGIEFSDLNAVAVTVGPGLIGALLVGVAAAKAYAFALRLPLVPVHHLEAHLYANFLEHPERKPPFVCLIVSGGHTSLVLVKEHLSYELLGSTRDDAAGEAFDKIARQLGLAYPGGPALEALARGGNPEAIPFPRAWLGENELDFSFSGLKTAVINYLQRARQKGDETCLADIAASFQAAVIDVLVEKTMWAARLTGVKQVALAGGVAANTALRSRFQTRAGEEGLNFFYPPIEFCTDNAAMVGCAGYFHYLAGHFASLQQEAYANFPLVSKNK